jgi:hypothetical protein
LLSSTILSRFLFVAQRIRQPAFTSRSPPIRKNCFSWRTCRSFDWRSMCISLISSRKMVPFWAISKRPYFCDGRP